jgi:hypothetical protein
MDGSDFNWTVVARITAMIIRELMLDFIEP